MSPLRSSGARTLDQLTELGRHALRGSLATRTAIATSALFLGAMLAVGYTSLESFRTQLTSVLIAEQNTLVHRIADDVDQKLRSRQRVLAASAEEITEADLADSDAAQRYLDRNTGLFAAFDRSTFLFSARGILLAERPFRSGRRGDDASWRPYIRDTIHLRQPIVSEPFLTNVGDANMVLVLTMPVFSREGHLIGIVSGSLGLTKPGMLGNIVKTVVGKSGYLFITTAEGKLVTHPDVSRLAQPAFAPGASALFDRALQGFEGTEETTDPRGRPALVSYHRVPSSNWIIAAVYPTDEAFLPVHALFGRFVEFLLGACFLVVAAVWVLTRYLMRPLVSLTAHLAGYSATDGMIEPLQGNSGSGEISSLRQAFNRLTQRLNERESALLETMQSYQLITENSTDLITKHGSDGAITFASPAARAVLGVESDAMVGRSFFEFVHPDDFTGVREAFVHVAHGGMLRTVNLRMRHLDQHYVWVESTLTLMRGASGERTSEVLVISRNISERKRMEQHLHDLARTDHLTALPNRFLLEERFAQALGQSRREGLLLAALMIDVDRFKNINDTLGHNVGDALLQQIAAKLKGCTREWDTLARWGGDEFVLLLPSLQEPDTAMRVAERCLAALKQPFAVEDQTLHITASIGVCTSSELTGEADSIFKNADTAMYRAKARGGDCLVLYATEMSAGAHNRLSMENALFHAIEREQLSLHYQPLIDARTGRLAGAEALIRWHHPDYGNVPPSEFVPIAEESGLIADIGEWVLTSACTQMNAWFARGLPRIRISVNVSNRQFRQERLAHHVRRVLDATRFDAQLLELELTESVVMDDTLRSRSIFAELKDLGVSIALDDFGTGYSSLSYLKGFPLDALKIDRTFIADLTTSEANASIVLATMGLARGLRLRTVAEGVETRAQANYLAMQGCDLLQGYFFARPMEPEAFVSFASASHTYLLSRPGRSEIEHAG